MDPADSSRLNEVLSAQSSLLDQHDQALRTLMDQSKNISQALVDLQTQIAALGTTRDATVPPADPAHASASTVPAHASASSPPLREPSVPAPDRFDGNLGECRSFLLQCSLVFGQQPYTYASDRAKISYLIGCLRGSALTWATAVWESQSDICSTYARFTEELRRNFDHPVRGKDAAKRLLSLHQGSRSVAEMAIEFRTLAAESGWNEEALHGVFQNALSAAIKDELVSRDEPNTLEDLISLAIRIDNRRRERRREKTGNDTFSVSPGVLPTAQIQSTSLPEIEPMQLGRARLSQEEKQRRRNSNSCLYCGQAGHYVSTCPLCPAKGRAQQ